MAELDGQEEPKRPDGPAWNQAEEDAKLAALAEEYGLKAIPDFDKEQAAEIAAEFATLVPDADLGNLVLDPAPGPTGFYKDMPPTVSIPLAEYDAMRQRVAEAEAQAEAAREEAAMIEPLVVVEPLLEVVIDGVTYKRSDQEKFTMEQFDRASAILTSLSPIIGAAFTTKKDEYGNEIAAFMMTDDGHGGQKMSFNPNVFDWTGIGETIKEALFQNRHAFLDMATIVYAADGVTFNNKYPFEEHRERISGGTADMFMESAAVFFGFYQRLMNAATPIFSRMAGTRTR